MDLAATLEGIPPLHESLSRVDKNVIYVLEILEDDKRAKILQWVPPVKHLFHHNIIREQRTARVCEWVSQRPEFKEWMSDTLSVTIWLHTTAGKGKTFLTSMAIDSIQARLEQDQNQEGFAFFYCNYLEQDR